MKRVRRAGKYKLSANSCQLVPILESKKRLSSAGKLGRKRKKSAQAGKHKIAKSEKQGTVAKCKKKQQHFFHLLMIATYLLTGTASA